MKKLLIIAALAAALTASAGQLITGTITIPGGSTNTVQDITLNPSASWDAPAIDAFVILNDGDATGTVSFAALDAGVTRAIGTSVTVLSGASATAYPIREYIAGGKTNLAPWRTRSIRAYVSHDLTNAATYTIGVITQ